MSAGRMWCGTCHDPHDKPMEPVQYFRSKCLSCHTGNFPASEHHPSAESNCIGCHMPRRNAKDGGHTVFTDHRIQRRPSAEQELPENVDIAAWREPAPQFQKRNLGIAYINVGAERRSREFVVRGYRLLTEVQQQFSQDDALFTAIGTALLLGKQPKEAEFAFDRALQLDPKSVSGETNDASAYLQAGDTDEAIAHLERAVALDPLDLTAVAPLIDLYRRQGNDSRANQLSGSIASALTQQSEPVNVESAALPAEKRYKNIQVLKGAPADQVIPAMHFITDSLGVECSYCHVPNHFDDDSKKPKQTARKMMRMMNVINNSNFDGIRAVTCYSCHRGSAKPIDVPVIANPAQRSTAADAVLPAGQLSTNLPTVDELIEKYIQSIGGATAVEGVISREAHGTATSDERTSEIEILDKFPDHHAVTRRFEGGENFTILNGRAGWIGASGHSVRELESSDLDAMKMANDLHLPLDLRRMFSELRVEYPEKVNERAVYVLSGNRPGLPPVKLYFDEQSGLLVRLTQFAESPLGAVPSETDYEDYRSVDEVQVPFRLTVARGTEISKIVLDHVVNNVSIDNGKFEKPAR
jgi:tetratricopeptide (TPR) repeat protein